MTESEHSRAIRNLADQVARTYRRDDVINCIGGRDLPSHDAILRVLARLLTVMFPGYHGDPVRCDADLHLFAAGHLERIHCELREVLIQSLRFSRRDDGVDVEEVADRLAMEYLEHLPAVREVLRTDVQAGFEGDPAAGSTDEVLFCYPGVYAIAVHRLAYPLCGMGVPLLPRIMSEHAHRRTGIDIHPGATIGPSFFIDHGTGVVVGETAEIGRRVKLYQGVTIGALSFARNPDGSLVMGGKRHPTLEDDITVYAGATLLGGDTVIGRGAVIGGGAWITASVPAGARVSMKRSAMVQADES